MASSVFERLVKTQRLPSPSTTALRVLELADKEDVSIVEVSEALACDPAITARLLKYANSPLVCPREEITTLQRAVMMLGIRAVKVTALSFSLIKPQDFSRCPHFKFDLYWAHAAATATAAAGIVAELVPALRDEAFVAGLLSRIGKLAFATAIPEEYEQVLIKTGNVMHGGTAEERSAFETDNIDVGASLLARWKLPSILVESVRLQVNPDSASNDQIRQVASAVRQGRQLADVFCGLVDRQSSAALEVASRHDVDLLEKQFRDMANALSISLKDLPDAEEIEGRARSMLEEMSVATQAENKDIQAKNKQLEQLALVDPLTGIGNRKAFDRQLAAELERSQRYGHPMSLLMLDVDRFKAVNDTHGHVTGDAVLKAVASKIRKLLRQCDFAARYGGEEFAVVAGETDLEAAGQLAERLRAAIQADSVPGPNGPVQVTISIGVASVVKSGGELDPIRVIAAADRKLYEAKQQGRNRCRHGIVGSPTPVAT